MTTIRPARPEDLPRVVALEQASYPAAEAATADMLAMRLSVAGDAFLVATDAAGEVIGFTCGTRARGDRLTHESFRHHDPRGESLCVHSVVVEAGARRQGLGRALVRAVVARARELPGVRRVLLICKEPLIGLYRACGFALIGPSEVAVGADPWFAMTLELASATPLLAHAVHGHGPMKVVVLHDWLGDRRSWDPVLPYLDPAPCTYALVDLRGYGESRDLAGAFTADEAVGDVLALADHLGWDRFAAVGHSMSGLIVQALAAAAPGRVTRVVAVTPVGPAGLAMPPDVLEAMERVALDPSARAPAVEQSLGERLNARWRQLKLERWNACSRPEAVLGYLRMFVGTDLRERVAGLDVPLLAIAGEHDAPWFSAAALEAGFACYPRREVVTCGNAGHYPMQETPVALATLLERFLTRASGTRAG